MDKPAIARVMHAIARADLGTILPVIFASAGLAELAITRKMPVPAWFNLLWWSLRAFMTFNEGPWVRRRGRAGRSSRRPTANRRRPAITAAATGVPDRTVSRVPGSETTTQDTRDISVPPCAIASTV
jgi:hypothetical protein